MDHKQKKRLHKSTIFHNKKFVDFFLKQNYDFITKGNVPSQILESASKGEKT